MDTLRLTTTVLLPLLILASGSPASQSARKVIDDTFEDVLYKPSKHEGEEVIWGGTVVGIDRNAGGSKFTLREIPLNYLGHAQGGKYSRGRFIAQSGDTTLARQFRIGDLVIITGTVDGSTTLPLGENETYTYPVLDARVIHPCYRAEGYGYVREETPSGLRKIEGPFCVDPETNTKHTPKEHNEHD